MAGNRLAGWQVVDIAETEWIRGPIKVPRVTVQGKDGHILEPGPHNEVKTKILDKNGNPIEHTNPLPSQLYVEDNEGNKIPLELDEEGRLKVHAEAVTLDAGEVDIPAEVEQRGYDYDAEEWRNVKVNEDGELVLKQPVEVEQSGSILAYDHDEEEPVKLTAIQDEETGKWYIGMVDVAPHGIVEEGESL